MAKAKEAGNGIIALIKEKQVSHAIKTIDSWKQAIKAFESKENPLRVKLHELYEDMLIDGQLEAVWGKRRDNILNRRLTFVRDGVEDEQISTLLNSPDMRNMLEELHNTIGFGYTLIQFNNIEFDEEQEYYHIDFDLISRAHVHPEKGFEYISIDPNRTTPDFYYKKPPLSNYMIWAGKPKDKGLFLKVAPYIIYKRGAMGDWSQFSEMFGMPFREALYDAFDDDTRQKVEQMMNEWGPGMSFVHPKSVEVKLHDTGGSTSSSDVYDRFIQVCDAAIAKTVVGNTLTTEQGESGNRALGEVHQSEEDEKKLSDELFVLSVLNTQFRAILKRFGFNVTGGAIWFETPDKDWAALLEKWKVISGIAGKVPIDDDWIYEEFDIPKPDNYDELKEEMRLERMAGIMPFGNNSVPDNTQTAVEIVPQEQSAKNVKNNLLRRVWNFFVKGSAGTLPKQ
jgi:hypothetical protein